MGLHLSEVTRINLDKNDHACLYHEALDAMFDDHSVLDVLNVTELTSYERKKIEKCMTTTCVQLMLSTMYNRESIHELFTHALKQNLIDIGPRKIRDAESKRFLTKKVEIKKRKFARRACVDRCVVRLRRLVKEDNYDKIVHELDLISIEYNENEVEWIMKHAHIPEYFAPIINQQDK